MSYKFVFPRLRRYHSLGPNPFEVATLVFLELYGFPITYLFTPNRYHIYSKRRHIVIATLARHTTLNYFEIASFFGYSRHSMVCHSLRFIENLKDLHTHHKIIDPYLLEYNLFENDFKIMFNR